MLDILTEKNMPIYEKYLHINRKSLMKKRVVLALLFLVLNILLYVYTENYLILLIVPLSLLFGYKVPYMELVRQKKQQDLIKQFMFPTFLRYFASLVDSKGNVYLTLKATIPYIAQPLREEVIILVKKLEEESTNNREAFMEFASYIDSPEAHMIMSMIYQFNEEGISKDDLRELENIINELQNNKTNQFIEYKVGTVEKHANPLLLYGLFYIMVFTGLVFMSYLNQINF